MSVRTHRLRDLPARAGRRAYRELVWYVCYRWNPFKQTRAGFQADQQGVESALRAAEIPVQPFRIPVSDFRRFLEGCGYPATYHHGGGTNHTEKCLEHFLSYRLLDLRPDDIYIDLASDGSPFPAFVRTEVGCRVFVNDLRYPAGLTDGWRIGSDASRLPLPDRSVSKATLHCSLEHFEGDSDCRLIDELARVLVPGGKVCILPLYLHTQYVGLTDPLTDRTGQEWDPAMTPIFIKGHGQRQGRFYDVAHLRERLLSRSDVLRPTLYRVDNLSDVAGGLWCHWILMFERIADRAGVGELPISGVAQTPPGRI